jgi:hypothetical protein
MEYTKLGRTGLDVSRICLGCMSYGEGDRGNMPGASGRKRAAPSSSARSKPASISSGDPNCSRNFFVRGGGSKEPPPAVALPVSDAIEQYTLDGGFTVTARFGRLSGLYSKCFADRTQQASIDAGGLPLRNQ